MGEPANETEKYFRFQVFFGGKFCDQFYFVMKKENSITTPQAKRLLNGTSAPRCHPGPLADPDLIARLVKAKPDPIDPLSLLEDDVI